MLAERDVKPVTESGRFKFTFEMFEMLSDGGHFADERVELLNGEIYVKGLQSTAHSYAIQNLSSLFHKHFAERATIRTQLPVILPSPPPDFVLPDLALLKWPQEQYRDRSPTALDALLVVEISNSTVEYDYTEKLVAYARNGIRDYWIYNLHTNQLEVMREPSGEEYLEIHKYKAGQSVATLEFPDVQLDWWV
jgi:Uma2 family endonuclease